MVVPPTQHEENPLSVYTDSVSQPGRRLTGGSDDKELFMKGYNDYLLEAWEETFDFENYTFVKHITAGKSDTFPIIGRKRDAQDHVKGEPIRGGGIEHNDKEITVDPVFYDAAFIADIDELMAHIPLVAPYARQIGESLASTANSRIARMMILASRNTTPDYTGGPVPDYYWDANVASDASKLEEAAFKGLEHIKENDIGGGKPAYWLPWQQQLLLARYTGIDTVDTSGSGNRAAGTVGQIASLDVKGTNSIPKTNVTTGLSKYQGNFSTTVGIIANKMAVGTLRMRGVTSTMTPQPDRIGTLLISHKIEGHGQLRTECAFEVASASR
jgi:hypothetical protein